MKTQTINLKYSLARAKALSHYLGKEGKTIEGELFDHLDEMYDKQVPEAVREFVASQYPDDDQYERVPDNKPGGKVSKNHRKKQTETVYVNDPQIETGPVLTM